MDAPLGLWTPTALVGSTRSCWNFYLAALGLGRTEEPEHDPADLYAPYSGIRAPLTIPASSEQR